MKLTAELSDMSGILLVDIKACLISLPGLKWVFLLTETNCGCCNFFNLIWVGLFCTSAMKTLFIGLGDVQ